METKNIFQLSFFFDFVFARILGESRKKTSDRDECEDLDNFKKSTNKTLKNVNYMTWRILTESLLKLSRTLVRKPEFAKEGCSVLQSPADVDNTLLNRNKICTTQNLKKTDHHDHNQQNAIPTYAFSQYFTWFLSGDNIVVLPQENAWAGEERSKRRGIVKEIDKHQSSILSAIHES